MTLASTEFKKSTFHKNSHLNAYGRKSDLVHLNKLGRPHIPIVTYQIPRSLTFSFLRKLLKVFFYYIWAWWPFSCDQNIMSKFWLTNHKESSHEN